MDGAIDFKRILENLAASASILAAVGYISLRSFANFVGMSGIELGIEQLLYECYSFISAFLIIAVPFGGVIFGLVLLVRVITAETICLTRFINCNSITLKRVIGTAAAAFAIALAIAVILVLRTFGSAAILVRPVREIAAMQQKPQVFILTVIVSLFAIYATRSFRIDALIRFALGARFARASRLYSLASATMLLWGAAVTYNTQFRQLKFPLVTIKEVQSRETTTICGLLLYNTSTSAYVWSMIEDSDGGSGMILVLPRRSIREVLTFADHSPVSMAQEWLHGNNAAVSCPVIKPT
jgi:hypothetical protein